jgi:hypothetical protein
MVIGGARPIFYLYNVSSACIFDMEGINAINID